MRRVALLTAAPVGLILIAAIGLGGGELCNTDAAGGGDPGNLTNASDIPKRMADAYTAMGRKEGVPIAALAAMGSIESNHGANPGVSSAGAQGPMQFLPASFGDYKCSADADIQDPMDAVCASARYVKVLYKQARAAGFTGEKAWSATFCGYNSGNVRATFCEGRYGADGSGATKIAISYGLDPDVAPGKPEAAGELEAGIGPDGGGSAQCAGGVTADVPAEGNGEWSQQLETPNRPGIGIAPILARFLDRVAEYTPYPPIVTTASGGRHAPGSDHYTGHGVDFGSVKNQFGAVATNPGVANKRGDALAAAALIAAGLDPATAKKKALAGLEPQVDDRVINFGGQRIRVQVIWKKASHQDHVHIGVKPV